MAKRRLKSPIKTISSIAPTFGKEKTKEYLKKLKNKRKKQTLSTKYNIRRNYEK